MTTALSDSFFFFFLVRYQLESVHKLLGLIVTIIQEGKFMNKLKFREDKDRTQGYVAK